MVLVTNAIAILSEDRFLARVGWSSSAPAEPAFGSGAAGDASVKSKIINLIASVRTLMRSMLHLESQERGLLWWAGFWRDWHREIRADTML